jgi:hypothetical protein
MGRRPRRLDMGFCDLRADGEVVGETDLVDGVCPCVRTAGLGVPAGIDGPGKRRMCTGSGAACSGLVSPAMFALTRNWSQVPQPGRQGGVEPFVVDVRAAVEVPAQPRQGVFT